MTRTPIHQPGRARRQERGFTLLEMLVVLVIIGLIASLVGPRLFAKVDSSKVQIADTQVRMLRGAVESFHLDVGRLPTQEEGLAVLEHAPAEDKGGNRWKGPYLDEGVPKDPWGNPYQYAIPGSNGMAFALYSFGADGKRGGQGNDADIGFLPP